MKKLYKIDVITNLHVGSGEINYSIVDNQVERDAITQYPIINGSGLKGALRAHFNKKVDENQVNRIFGNEKRGQGSHRFFSANILSIPVRSNERPFYNGTSIGIIKEFINKIEIFNFDFEGIDSLRELTKLDITTPVMFEKREKDVYVENIKVEYKNFKKIEVLEKLIGEDVILFDDINFKEISEQLPVIARNKLENGKSQNLWYEEVVPNKSKFYTIILNDENEETFLENLIAKDIIQIGGNASIGYGYTKFEELSGDKNE